MTILHEKNYLADFYKLIIINFLLLFLAIVGYYQISPKIHLSIIVIFYTGIFFICINSLISCFFLLKILFNRKNPSFSEKSEKYYLKQSKYCIIISTLNLCLILSISIFNWI